MAKKVCRYIRYVIDIFMSYSAVVFNLKLILRLLSKLVLSWVEIKPASKGRNDPASGARIRPHEKRGIFLSNKPDIKELMRACLEENADLRRFSWLGHFDHCWLVCSDR